MIHRCFICFRWNVSHHFVSCEWRTLILALRCIIWTRLANINIWVKFRSRNSEVFKIYTKYLSFLVYNQVYNLFFVPCVLVWLHFWNETETNHCEIPARSTCMCHVKESFKTRLRYVNMTYSDYFWFAWKKKNCISNLHVIGMPLNEQSQFFFPMQFYHHRLLGFLTKPKKS